jgi:hypothetical protein
MLRRKPIQTAEKRPGPDRTETVTDFGLQPSPGLSRSRPTHARCHHGCTNGNAGVRQTHTGGTPLVRAGRYCGRAETLGGPTAGQQSLTAAAFRLSGGRRPRHDSVAEPIFVNKACAAPAARTGHWWDTVEHTLRTWGDGVRVGADQLRASRGAYRLGRRGPARRHRQPPDRAGLGEMGGRRCGTCGPGAGWGHGAGRGHGAGWGPSA